MKLLMIIFSLLISGTLHAQVVKAFQQEIIGGSMSIFADDQGREFRGSSRDTIFLIYLQAEKPPTIKQLWVNGKRYQFTIAEVVTPVTINRSMTLTAKKDTLVEHSAMKTYRIIPGVIKEVNKRKARNAVMLITSRSRITTTEIKKLDPHYSQ